MKICSFLFILILVSSGCSSIKNPKHSQKFSLLPVSSYSLSDLRLQDSLGHNSIFSNRTIASNEDAWVWRKHFAIGASMQSFAGLTKAGLGKWVVTTLGEGTHFIDLNNGGEQWKFVTNGGVGSKALVTNDSVYFVAMDNYFYKLSKNTGKIVWKQKVSAESYGGIVAANGLVIANLNDNSVWALDGNSGTVAWAYRRPASSKKTIWSLRGQAVPLLSNDKRQVFVAFSDGGVVSLNPLSGIVQWKKTMPINTMSKVKDSDLHASIYKDNLIIAVADGNTYGLATKSGDQKWEIKGPNASGPVVSEDGKLFSATTDGKISAYNLLTQNKLWTYIGKNGQYNTPTLAGKKHLVAVNVHQGIDLINRENGSLVSSEYLGAKNLSSATVEGNNVFIVNPDNRLLVYQILNSSRNCPQENNLSLSMFSALSKYNQINSCGFGNLKN